MDAIFCNNCGAELDEAPTLLPDQRQPCPACGSLSRRIEITTGANITVGSELGMSVQAHAGVAEGTGEAFDATVQTINAHGIPSAAQVGDATAVHGPRIIRDHLPVQACNLWWTRLTEEGGWLLQVVDGAGEEIADWGGYDPVEGLAAVAEYILPRHPG